MVLRSPFTSVVDVPRAHFGPVPRALARDRFPSEERIADIDAPMLVLATRTDEVMPYELSQRLAEAVDARPVTHDASGHNAPAMLHVDQLLAAVEQFLAEQDLLPGP